MKVFKYLSAFFVLCSLFTHAQGMERRAGGENKRELVRKTMVHESFSDAADDITILQRLIDQTRTDHPTDDPKAQELIKKIQQHLQDAYNVSLEIQAHEIKKIKQDGKQAEKSKTYLSKKTVLIVTALIGVVATVVGLIQTDQGKGITNQLSFFIQALINQVTMFGSLISEHYLPTITGYLVQKASGLASYVPSFISAHAWIPPSLSLVLSWKIVPKYPKQVLIGLLFTLQTIYSAALYEQKSELQLNNTACNADLGLAQSNLTLLQSNYSAIQETIKKCWCFY